MKKLAFLSVVASLLTGCNALKEQLADVLSPDVVVNTGEDTPGDPPEVTEDALDELVDEWVEEDSGHHGSEAGFGRDESTAGNYDWWGKYSKSLLDCYQEENAREHGLPTWSPLTTYEICRFSVENGFREMIIVDAESKRGGTSQHNRGDVPENPGDAIDFHPNNYGKDCETNNQTYLQNFLAFRDYVEGSERLRDKCSYGFYPKRWTIHFDCRNQGNRWCHFIVGKKLYKKSIDYCLINFDKLKRDCD